MAHDMRSTFFSIRRCPNVRRCLAGDKSHPCYEIVSHQGTGAPSEFQLPEPWVGRLDLAPILFVASNPSIGDDDHATMVADYETVWESHYLAFGGGSRAYILDGIRTTTRDGSPIKAVRYWASVKARAAERGLLRSLRATLRRSQPRAWRSIRMPRETRAYGQARCTLYGRGTILRAVSSPMNRLTRTWSKFWRSLVLATTALLRSFIAIQTTSTCTAQ